MNEGEYAEAGLVDDSSTQWASEISRTFKALCLKLNVVFIYFCKQILYMKQFHKIIANFGFNYTRDQPVQ